MPVIPANAGIHCARRAQVASGPRRPPG